ncbi:MAG: hypothetical protein ACRDL1_01010 [Solirubrobacterales bacterium]
MEPGVFEFELSADHDAPGRVRDALELALVEVDPGARLTVGLLAKATAASCIRGDGGRVRIEPKLEPGLVRVEVSGEGDGFRLPLSSRDIDYFCFDDTAAPPIGWRSYLLDRLADDWGIDEEARVAWFQVDLLTATDAPLPARRLALRR